MKGAGPSTKKLRTMRELASLVMEYYAECHRAKAEGRPVGWMPPMNGGIEVFYAMGLMPVFPENYSPVCAAFGAAPMHFETSEAMGFSRDLCGYMRNILGYVHGDMHGPLEPMGGLPEPDLIMSFGGGCIPAMKIFQHLERRFPHAKVFRADMPQVALDDIKEHHVAYAVSEMHRFIEFLERNTGRKLDEERLHEAVNLSDEACRLFDRIMSFRRNIPAPFGASEIGLMFVMVTRQGTRTAVDFLSRVLDEVACRAEARQGVVEEERLRLFWDNIPPWYDLGLLRYFEKAGGVVVAETYSSAWSIRLDTGDPIRALAVKSLMSYPLVSCVSIDRRRDMVLRACRDYAIDGAVFHSNKSCVPITLGQADIMKALERELGIPSVTIDGDHMDIRNFSLAQFQTRADAFMETLLERKGR